MLDEYFRLTDGARAVSDLMGYFALSTLVTLIFYEAEKLGWNFLG